MGELKDSGYMTHKKPNVTFATTESGKIQPIMLWHTLKHDGVETALVKRVIVVEV